MSVAIVVVVVLIEKFVFLQRPADVTCRWGSVNANRCLTTRQKLLTAGYAAGARHYVSTFLFSSFALSGRLPSWHGVECDFVN